jgi:predicted permease
MEGGANEIDPGDRGLSMDTIVRDLRYAIRTLRRAPGFTTVVVLTLALGIGANTAVFSVVNGVLLRPLPLPEPERLVYIGWRWGDGEFNTTMTAFKYAFLREHARVFEGVSTEQAWLTELGEDWDEVRGLRATPDVFRVNGIAPVLGRAFTDEEARPGAGPVVVLSDAVWRTRFDADPAVLGRAVRLGGVPHTVVGVLPAGVRLPEVPDYADFVVPYVVEPDPRDEGHNYRMRARLAPGVTRERAEAELRALSARFREAHPELMDADEIGFTLLGYGDVFVGGLARTLWLLLGAVGFVLLIACANVAHLMLARAITREREIAVRTAIGAGRGRIVRQLVAESLVLAVAGAALGVLLAGWSMDALLALAPAGLPRMEEITLDWRVLGFTLAVALATGLAFGLAAAAHAFRVDPAAPLRGARQAGTPARRRARAAIATAEAALAVVLLTGAGLLIRSFFELRGVDAGFEPQHVLAVEFRRTPPEYADVARARQFEDALLARIRRLPGVLSAAASSALPLESQFNFPMTVVGRPDATRGDVQWRAVGPAYFETLRIPLLRGRAFTEQDGASGPPVVIIDELFARKYFPGEDPIGKRIDIGTFQGREVIPGFDEPEREIVGVVGAVHVLRLDEAPIETMYIPRAQAPQAFDLGGLATLAVRVDPRAGRAAALAPALLAEMRALEPRMPAPHFREMTDVVGASMAHERFNTVLLGVFAALALMLTAIGIYGIATYAAQQRAREIAIRVALGAQHGAVVRQALREGMAPVALGLGAGVVAAAALTRLMSGLLFGVSPTDPRTFAAVPVMLAALAGLAIWLPARRAAAADPMEMLRQE